MGSTIPEATVLSAAADAILAPSAADHACIHSPSTAHARRTDGVGDEGSNLEAGLEKQEQREHSAAASAPGGVNNVTPGGMNNLDSAIPGGNRTASAKDKVNTMTSASAMRGEVQTSALGSVRFTEDSEELNDIRSTLEKSDFWFRQKEYQKCFKVINKVVKKHNSSCLVYWLEAKFLRAFALKTDDSASRTRYFDQAVYSAAKASSLAPCSMNLMRIHASILYETARNTNDYQNVSELCKKYLGIPTEDLTEDGLTDILLDQHIRYLTFSHSRVNFSRKQLCYIQQNSECCIRVLAEDNFETLAPQSVKRNRHTLLPDSSLMLSLKAMKERCTSSLHFYSTSVSNLKKKLEEVVERKGQSLPPLSLQVLCILEAERPMIGWPCFCRPMPFESIDELSNHLLEVHTGSSIEIINSILPDRSGVSRCIDQWRVWEEETDIDASERSKTVSIIRKLIILLNKCEVWTTSHRIYVMDLMGKPKSMSSVSTSILMKVAEFVKRNCEILKYDFRSSAGKGDLSLLPSMNSEYMFVRDGILFADLNKLKLEPFEIQTESWKGILIRLKKLVEHLQVEINLLLRLSKENQNRLSSVTNLQRLKEGLIKVKEEAQNNDSEVIQISQYLDMGSIAKAAELIEIKSETIRAEICMCDSKMRMTVSRAWRMLSKVKRWRGFDYQQEILRLCLLSENQRE